MDDEARRIRTEFYAARYDKARADLEARLTEQIVQKLSEDAASRDQTAWIIALGAAISAAGWAFNDDLYYSIGIDIDFAVVMIALVAFVLLTRDWFSRSAHRRLMRIARRAKMQ